MVERERLIKLLKRFEPCGYENCESCHDDCYVAQRADFLIKNNIIILPCKIGDIVFNNDYGAPCGYEVTGFSIGKTTDDEVQKELFMYYENDNGSIRGRCAISEIGKSVFLNKKDAEAELCKSPAYIPQEIELQDWRT